MSDDQKIDFVSVGHRAGKMHAAALAWAIKEIELRMIRSRRPAPISFRYWRPRTALGFGLLPPVAP